MCDSSRADPDPSGTLLRVLAARNFRHPGG
jgi:hypothetical protein